ncbi:phosphotransferase family protein [Roseovarius sp. ZX-A-9]|uniref:phosphotransferase family protein n=1 Tax=Roseovarius sp. ZX-A-9 TaxID=3014783 RepID=UPI00232C4489|nr:phosphotransferase family protein [Roseovarius sp. ZX-A-9]
MTDLAAIPADIAALAPVIAARVPSLGGTPQVRAFGKGQSNPTYLLEGPESCAVLRVQPPGPLLKGAHAVDREFRVMDALRDTRVPVPRMLLQGGADETLDRRYIVMQMVSGVTHWDPALPGMTSALRGQIYGAMAALLADLHMVDIEACGLGDYGRPGNYFARQFATWTRQYRAAEVETNPDIERLIGWLEANQPEDDGAVSLVHGDFRIDNMIFAEGSAEVRALLDWELSTLGHPLADLAYQCMQWRLPNENAFKGLGGVDRATLGIPDEAEYVATYCRHRGLPGIDNWSYYLAFSFFRLTAILQGIYRRYLDGNAANAETALQYGQTVPILAALAVEMIDESVAS